VSAPQWVPLAVVGVVILIGVAIALIVVLRDEASARKARRIAAIETELDEKAEQMRATIYEIASALSSSGHQARKDMIREAYLQSGRLPD